jgi:hypothetical protein
MKLFFKFSLMAFFFLFCFSTTLPLNAATTPKTPPIPPQVILTWSASNFYPSNYAGRALPSTQTPITVSAELLLNGKFTDISKAQINWYKLEDKIEGGVGLKQIVVIPDTNDLDSIFVRAEVVLNDTTSEQSILIPISKPVVAIEIPYPHSVIDANTDITLRAVPYFFNISSLDRLIFYWQVGSIKKDMGSDNSIALKIGTPSTDAQKTVGVSSYVQSKDDLTMIIKTDTNLYIR